MPSADELVSQNLSAQIDSLGIETWLVPLGIAHPDHIQTRRAAASLFHEKPSVKWIIYEELPYPARFPEEYERLIRSRVGPVGSEADRARIRSR